MARYEITSPDGVKYEITAPEGATQDEITSYVQTQLTTQSVEPEAAMPSIGRTALDQGLQGATFGFADEITDRIGAGIASIVTDESYSDLLDEARGMSKERLANQMEQRPALSIGANLGGALLTGGAGATTKAGTAIGNSLRTGGLTARVAKGAAAGAGSGALYGAGTAQEGERLSGAGEGAILGSIGGAAIPAVGAALKGAGNALIPTIDDAIKPLANRAKDLGIPLRLDQISPTRARRTVQKVSQELPLSGVDAFEGKQLGAFNRALAKTIGQKADAVTPDVVDKFLKSADRKFGAVAKNKVVPMGQMPQRVNVILQDASETLEPSLLSVVEKNASKILDSIDNGTMSGAKLASLRSSLVKNSSKASAGSKQYISELVGAIDDAIDPVLTNAQRKLLQTARREYRNFKTIEPLLEKATDGMVNPTQLISRVAASPYIKSSRAALGEDELIDLARIGKQFLPKQGGSDTMQKAAFGAGGVGLAGTALVNPVAGAALAGKAALGIGANRAFQSGLNTSQRAVNSALNKTAGQASGLIPNIAAAQGANAIEGAVNGANTIERAVTSAPLFMSYEQPPESPISSYMAKAKQAESGGKVNAKNPNSSASGLYQFTNGTWKNMVRKYGDEAGITLKDKNNPQAQEYMMQKLTMENANGLAPELGRMPTDGELYIAHFMGLGGAKRLLSKRGSREKAAKLFPKEAKANRSIFFDSGRARSVQEIIAILERKVS